MDKLIEKIVRLQNPTALGLDTCIEYIPQQLKEKFGEECSTLESAANAIYKYNCLLIDALADIIPCVKVQVAYYEMYGSHGMESFHKTIVYAQAKGMYAIADIKRNDIGATAAAYANAYLGSTMLKDETLKVFNCDSVTINGYLGTDGIKPFTDLCKSLNKSAFILVKTSNPSSGELQDQTLSDGRKVFELMGDMVAQWGSEQIGSFGYSNIGAVVGATYPEQGEQLRNRLKSVFFLIPGYGAQGAGGKDLVGSFDKDGLGGIVNASRSILCAYKKYSLPAAESARAEAIAMKEDIVNSLKQAKKWDF